MAWCDAENFWGGTGGRQAKFRGAVASPGTPLAPPLCSTMLLCLFTSKYVSGNRLNCSTVSSKNLSILICKSSATSKQSVVSVALKTPLEIRLWICVYKWSLLHRPDDYSILVSHQAAPHILQQNCAHGGVSRVWEAWHMPWAPFWRVAKTAGKIKIFIYSSFNLYFAPHAFINCKAASTPRPYLKH